MLSIFNSCHRNTSNPCIASDISSARSNTCGEDLKGSVSTSRQHNTALHATHFYAFLAFIAFIAFGASAAAFLAPFFAMLLNTGNWNSGECKCLQDKLPWTRWTEKTPYYAPQGGGSHGAMIRRILCIVCWACGEHMNLMRNLVLWPYLTQYLSYCWNHKHPKSFQNMYLCSIQGPNLSLKLLDSFGFVHDVSRLLVQFCKMLGLIFRFSCLTSRVTYLMIRFGNSNFPKNP